MKKLLLASYLIFTIFQISNLAQNSRKIDAYVKQEMTKYQIPGLSLAVVKEGKVLKIKDYGIGSVEFNSLLEPNTSFQLFSTSKIFAGVAVMKLVEDRKLSLNTPVTDIIDNLPPEWKKIRVRNLLTHTSGLPNGSANSDLARLPREKAENLTADEFIKYITDLPLSFEPGEKFSYGQPSYILAGLIVEKLAGKSYADFLQERVFAPLEMTSTKFGGTNVFIERRPPTVYNRENNSFKTWNYPFSPKDYPAAGLNSSAADLAKFFAAIDSGKVLKPESLQALWSPVKLNDGTQKNYGLGWTIEEHDGRKAVGHEGGGSIWAAHFPAEHLTVIILCNLNGARADEIQYGVADFYLKGNQTNKISANFATAIKRKNIEKQIVEISKTVNATVGVAAKSIEDGEVISYHPKKRFPMQSVYKFPIAMAILNRVDRGALKLEEMIHVEKSDFVTERQHSPIRDKYPSGIDLSIRELLRYSVSESDGTACDVLLRILGGPEEATNYLREIGVGGIMIATTEREQGQNENVQYRNWSTPEAMLLLLRKFYEGKGLSTASRNFLVELMTNTTTGLRRIKGLLPPEVAVSHKTGTSNTIDGITRATNDVGIITLPDGRHLAIAVFVSDATADDAIRDDVIAKISRTAWDYWTNVLQREDKKPNSSPKKNNPAKVKLMVLIPGATFKMGTDSTKITQIAEAFKVQKHPDLIQSETPQHTVTLDSFYLDKYEVTNKQFQKFVKSNPEWTAAKIPKEFNNGNYLKDWLRNNFPKEKASHPVVNVSWYAAVAYCQSVGKRLPSEAEWEYAARGGLVDKIFPWGDEPVDKTRANYGGSEIKTTTPVGSYPANGYGLFDMAGNVWEFTADEWAAYSDAAQNNPVAGGNLFLDKSFYNVTTRRVIRGGSWGGAPLNLHVTYRDSHPPDGAREFVGFRCAASKP